MTRKALFFLATSLTCSLVSSIAFAQSSVAKDDATGVQDIVVTSLRRSTVLQQTPISVVAVTEKNISEMGATNLPDYFRQVPNLNLTQGGLGGARISIRGINSAGEATVGLYYDETPITGPSGTTQDPGGGSADLNLFDVARVEVLRGPQGTLYGSSSMGGTLRLIFNKPNTHEWEMAAEGQASTMRNGSAGYFAKGMVNYPIAEDKLALRLVTFYEKRGGFVDNIRLGTKDVNDSKSVGARGLLTWTPTPDMNLTGTYLYQKTDADDQEGWYPSLGEFNTDSRVKLPFNNTLNLFNLTYNWELPGVTLTATGSYYKYEILRATDFTASYVPLLTSNAACQRFYSITASCTPAQQSTFATSLSGQFPIGGWQPGYLKSRTLEVRASSRGNGPLTWTLGAYYEHRNDYIDSNTSLANPLTGDFYMPLQNRAYRWVATDVTQKAAFAEVSYNPVEPLTLTVGARRYDYEKVTSGETPLGDRVFGGVSAPYSEAGANAKGWLTKFNASYKFSSRIMGYVTAAQGFRPGGANNIPVLPQGLVPYGADKLWNYEVGLKTSWLNGALVANLAAYQTDWTNIQTSARTADNAFSFITNAGAARVKGGELEVTARPARGFTLGAAAGYIDARLTEDQRNASVLVTATTGRAGDRLPSVPKFNASMNATYTWPVFSGYDGLVRLDYAYTGQMQTTFRTTDPNFTTYGDYGTVNLRIGIENGKRGIYLFAQNLTDIAGVTGASRTVGGPPVVYSLPPRVIGVNARIAY
ncbi:MAG TPA: TonB-dependent receptor [Caulobacteraceae bacterium]|jgi:outer membrane receptor protein involved in Fe transport|nr:TonB-dependent receptor [Caulobacteraceae bacterium]